MNNDLFSDRLIAPGAPKFFRIVQKNASTIHLEWNKPLEPNGILTGYTLKYKTG